jgi:transposase
MGQNLIRADRDQLMLLPVDVREWLDEDDIAWFVVDVVDELDLGAFYARYRSNGQGAAAYDPRLMIALVVYAHVVGVKSSRQIERACTRDAGFKVVAGQLVPDHCTIARFVRTHEEAMAGLFVQVLRLCHASGMLRLGVIAVDGTKIAANASWAKSYTAAALEHQIREQQDAFDAEQAQLLAARLVSEQVAVDEAEDRVHGPDGGGRREDLPPSLRRRAQRLEKLRAARADLAARDEAAKARMRAQQKAKQDAYDAKVAAGARPNGARPKDEVKTGHEARAKRDGTDVPLPRASVTDPGSRRMKAKNGFLQAYNAQASVTTDQVILAGLVSQDPTDHHQLPAVLDKTRANLIRAGIITPDPADEHDPTGHDDQDGAGEPPEDAQVQAALVRASQNDDEPGVILADAGYANEDTFKDAHKRDLHLLAPLTSDEKRARDGALDAGQDLATRPHTALAQQRLATETGRRLYKHRGQSVEPTFGQLKDRGGLRQFARRGLSAVQTEFTLACTVHNLRKLFTYKNSPGYQNAPATT